MYLSLLQNTSDAKTLAHTCVPIKALATLFCRFHSHQGSDQQKIQAHTILFGLASCNTDNWVSGYVEIR